ncbi:MAG: AAA family ATPase [Myxococcaceae bacterium]|nr:AAA family ATPase [Myxococcaceae bacterium]
MIRKVSFRNFKAYRSLDLELEPFTVLVGPNASGKTTLLEGLHQVSRMAAGMEKDGQAGSAPRSVQSFGVSAPVELTLSGNWKGTEGVARLLGTPEKSPTEEPALLEFFINGEWNGKSFPAAQSFGPPFNPPLSEFRAALSSTAVLRFEPRSLSEASYSDEPVPSLHSDGSGLASVLAYLKLSQDEVFDQIEQALRQVVPAVKRIRIERAEVWSRPQEKGKIGEIYISGRKVWGNQVILDMRGAKGVSANAAGEGTLMALALLTVLMGPAQPRLVLLDDIELSLHPAAQAKLIEVLRAIQKRDPELQIVATSHSPFILNYLDPKEVRMTFLAENGFARCEKLTAHPEFEKWKDLMSPGEFWSTVGESWVEKAGEASVSE